MLCIPVPTRDLDGLSVLVTDDPPGDGVATCPPELADQLLERWVGAVVHDADGQRWLYLPYEPAKAS